MIPAERRHILAIGGAHLDRRGRLFAAPVPGASNPGHWREEAGGGTFNAARCLARLGHSVRLISPRGGDREGEIVATAAAAAGLDDTPLTFLDRATPSYTAILDPDGELVIALADMALYDLYGARQIARRSIRDAIDAADAVLTDANLPAATLIALAETARQKDRPIYAIAVSPAKIVRVAPMLPLLSGLFMNERELNALAATVDADDTDALKRLVSAGLRKAVVTRGARPPLALNGESIWQARTLEIEAVGDVTGAGDALAAGFVDAELAGLGTPEALRAGIAAASLAVRSHSAIAEDFGRPALSAALALVPEAENLA